MFTCIMQYYALYLHCTYYLITFQIINYDNFKIKQRTNSSME